MITPYKGEKHYQRKAQSVGKVSAIHMHPPKLCPWWRVYILIVQVCSTECTAAVTSSLRELASIRLQKQAHGSWSDRLSSYSASCFHSWRRANNLEETVWDVVPWVCCCHQLEKKTQTNSSTREMRLIWSLHWLKKCISF